MASPTADEGPALPESHVAQLAGTLWPAVVVCAATFGFGHIGQGWSYGVIACLYALVFHALTLATGSLLVAMVVHVAINVTSGFRAGTWAERSSATSTARTSHQLAARRVGIGRPAFRAS